MTGGSCFAIQSGGTIPSRVHLCTCVWLVKKQTRKVCGLRNRLLLKDSTPHTVVAHLVEEPGSREKRMESSEEKYEEVALTACAVFNTGKVALQVDRHLGGTRKPWVDRERTCNTRAKEGEAVSKQENMPGQLAACRGCFEQRNSRTGIAIVSCLWQRVVCEAQRRVAARNQSGRTPSALPGGPVSLAVAFSRRRR